MEDQTNVRYTAKFICRRFFNTKLLGFDIFNGMKGIKILTSPQFKYDYCLFYIKKQNFTATELETVFKKLDAQLEKFKQIEFKELVDNRNLIEEEIQINKKLAEKDNGNLSIETIDNYILKTKNDIIEYYKNFKSQFILESNIEYMNIKLFDISNKICFIIFDWNLDKEFQVMHIDEHNCMVYSHETRKTPNPNEKFKEATLFLKNQFLLIEELKYLFNKLDKDLEVFKVKSKYFDRFLIDESEHKIIKNEIIENYYNFKSQFLKTKNQTIYGYDLGLTENQLSNLFEQLKPQYLDKATTKENFINAFNSLELNKNFKPIKWKKVYYASIFLFHYIEHPTKWKLAEQIFDNGNASNLKNSYNESPLNISKNQEIVHSHFNSIMRDLQ